MEYSPKPGCRAGSAKSFRQFLCFMPRSTLRTNHRLRFPKYAIVEKSDPGENMNTTPRLTKSVEALLIPHS